MLWGTKLLIFFILTLHDGSKLNFFCNFAAEKEKNDERTDFALEI